MEELIQFTGLALKELQEVEVGNSREFVQQSSMQMSTWQFMVFYGLKIQKTS